ncbi:MAG: hypothetical protein PHY02_10015 [Phycisphaerae bacterium]|nr:hypothetical protein [Phycisphaerae bacterium]
MRKRPVLRSPARDAVEKQVSEQQAAQANHVIQDDPSTMLGTGGANHFEIAALRSQ